MGDKAPEWAANAIVGWGLPAPRNNQTSTRIYQYVRRGNATGTRTEQERLALLLEKQVWINKRVRAPSGVGIITEVIPYSEDEIWSQRKRLVYQNKNQPVEPFRATVRFLEEGRTLSRHYPLSMLEILPNGP